jgi:hypothetical protein
MLPYPLTKRRRHAAESRRDCERRPGNGPGSRRCGSAHYRAASLICIAQCSIRLTHGRSIDGSALIATSSRRGPRSSNRLHPRAGNPHPGETDPSPASSSEKSRAARARPIHRAQVDGERYSPPSVSRYGFFSVSVLDCSRSTSRALAESFGGFAGVLTPVFGFEGSRLDLFAMRNFAASRVPPRAGTSRRYSCGLQHRDDVAEGSRALRVVYLCHVRATRSIRCASGSPLTPRLSRPLARRSRFATRTVLRRPTRACSARSLGSRDHQSGR